VVDTVECLALEDLDTEVLRVEATEVTHSVILVALLDTVSHDHLSLEEMHLTMHTLSEVNNSFIQKRTPEMEFFYLSCSGLIELVSINLKDNIFIN
jgi:hypothetical protein